MDSRSADWQQIRQAFQQIWGYEDFRPPQGEIIRSLLAKKDALVVMPTGAGKSLCFQLPALLSTGLTLVVSPLVALMENQVRQLQQRRLPAALLHSELPIEQRQQTLTALARQRLLYLSPETLLNPSVWKRLSDPNLPLNGLILDEAHCLVQWGETFRPEYQRLGAVRPAMLQHRPPGTSFPIAAFTATADTATQQILERSLGLQQPELFCLNPYRNNLNLQVKIAWTPQCRRQQLRQFLQGRRGQTGLIYVRSRQDSETLAQWLRSQDFPTAAYHAGLSPQQRRQIEADWLAGKLPFTICTSAFGLGIDRADVRWVVHFHPPSLLAEYLQEVGRSGRDGKPADALLLAGEPTGWLDPQDRQRERAFAERRERQYQQARELLGKIPAQGEVSAIARQFRGGEVALSLLHRCGQLEWSDPFHYRLASRPYLPPVAQFRQQQQQPQAQMRQYLRASQCRWQFLLAAFGFFQEARGFRCGHCDNCRR
jgi:ATP-dependent DNA helicase RecQ